MKNTILLYGLVGGLLIAGLRFIEYRFLLVEHSVEIYAALIAAIFSAIGIWLGLRITRPTERVVVREVPVQFEIRVPVEVPMFVDVAAPPALSAAAVPRDDQPFVADPVRLRELGITPRELQILEAIAEGSSNREIAAKLFISENTVKTHSSRLFDKLNARRRTQAVQLAKEAGLIA